MTLLSPGNPAWLDAWSCSHHPEVFAHPAYAALFEDEKTLARAFLWEGTEGSIIYPFLLRDLQGEPFWQPELGEAYDIITPYGYGGPVVVAGKPSQELYRRFFAALEHWATQNKVVSEFVRFSLFDQAPLAYYGLVQHQNDNIVVDLTLSHEDLWKGFRHKVRKNVHAALSAGITIEEDPAGERMSGFLEVYQHTLKRRNAAKQYFKPVGFFNKLTRTLAQHIMFFHAISGKKVVASELVLLSDSRIYSYMGGTLCQNYQQRPGDLLKYHIVKWARRQGYKQFVIGGGHKPHDGIFAFKQAFAPTGIYPFFTGKKVFDHAVYKQLVKHPTEKDDFFPEYRLGDYSPI